PPATPLNIFFAFPSWTPSNILRCPRNRVNSTPRLRVLAIHRSCRTSTASRSTIKEVLPLVPGTIEELYNSSAEVLEVTVVSSKVAGVGQPPRVRTFYTAIVNRPIKSNLKEGQTVVFTQAAGELELADKIIRAADPRTLPLGDRYIVFLRHNDSFGGRMLSGERDGAFKVRGGHVEPQGSSRLAVE